MADQGRKEPEESKRGATSKHTYKAAGAELNARPAILLHRLRVPVSATEQGANPPHRLDENCNRTHEVLQGGVDVNAHKAAGGEEVISDDRGCVSLWAFEERVFGATSKGRKRFKSAVNTHHKGMANAPKCRTWRHAVAAGGEYAKPTGIKEIRVARELKYFTQYGMVSEAGAPLRTINGVALGREDTGVHWATCCVPEEAAAYEEGAGDGGGSDAEPDDAGDAALQHDAWFDHAGSFVCGKLMMAVRGWTHQAEPEWAAAYDSSLEPPTATDVMLALLYHALFRAWPAGALAEWQTLDDCRAAHLVALGMRIRHGVATRGPHRMDANQQLVHDGMAVQLHRCLGVDLPVFTADTVAQLASSDADTDPGDASSDDDANTTVTVPVEQLR